MTEKDAKEIIRGLRDLEKQLVSRNIDMLLDDGTVPPVVGADCIVSLLLRLQAIRIYAEGVMTDFPESIVCMKNIIKLTEE